MGSSSYMQNLSSYSSSSGHSSADANMQGGLRIDYKMFNELMQLVYAWGKEMKNASSLRGSGTYDCVTRMGIDPLLDAGVQWEQRAGDALLAVGDCLNSVQFHTSVSEQWVRSAVYDWDGWANAVGNASLTHATASFADEYYPAFDEAQKEEQRKRERRTAILGLIATHFPAVYDEYQQKIYDAEEDALLKELAESDDPEDRALYEMIMAQKEREKKAAEEAEKAAQEAADAAKAMESADGDAENAGTLGGDGLGEGLGGFGSDFGGSDFGGSDFGSSDWGSEDWASDLLGDNLDTDELLGAADALDEIAGADVADAIGTGVEAAADAADLGEGGGVFGKYGPQLAEMAQRYGVQTGLAIGGAIAAYATREQTTEAVAHVAEFVSTKCKPAVTDVMDQVSGAAKKTRVRLGNAKSNMVATARGEKAGDLNG